jgi:gas vesicle protein
MESAPARDDDQGSGYSGRFMAGLVTGAMVGAGVAMLFAPKAGSELRRQLSEQADKLASNTSETYRRVSDGAAAWANKAQGFVSEWARKASNAADEVAQRGTALYNKACGVANGGAELLRDERYASRPPVDVPPFHN